MHRFAIVWMACCACVGSPSGVSASGDDAPTPPVPPDARPVPPDAPPDAPVVDAPPDAPPPPPACVPLTCDELSANCGGLDDGCGKPLDCGTCGAPSVCSGQGQANVCALPLVSRTCAGGWCWEAPWPLPYAPTSASMVSANDVWAVGLHGFVQHFDGAAWQLVGVGTTVNLNGVWMASATDGWMVGDGGTLRRWNGTAWTTVASGTAASLRGVAGTAANNVWVVGDQVTLHWNGTRWTSAAVSQFFRNVYVPPDGKVVASDGGQVWQLTSGGWQPVSNTPSFTHDYVVFGISGAGNTAYAIGEDHQVIFFSDPTLEAWDGTAWNYQSTSDTYTGVYGDGRHVYAYDRGQVTTLDTPGVVAEGPPNGRNLGLVTGIGNQLVDLQTAERPWRFQDGTWTSSAYGNYDNLLTLGVAGDSVWFAGLVGLLEWNGGVVSHRVGDSFATPVAIAGPSRDAAWVVTGDSFFGNYVVYQRHDHAWVRNGNAPDVIHAIHVGADPDDVVVIGHGIYHKVTTGAATTWVADSSEPSIAGVMWRASSDVGDDIVAVGDDVPTTTGQPSASHVALRHAGQWTTVPAPSSEHLCGVAATASNDVWAVGYNGLGSSDTVDPPSQGTVSHWNGTAWTTTVFADATTLCAIALDHGELWTAGESSPLHHRASNGSWDTSWPLGVGSIRGLGVAGDSLWLVGDGGAILRRPR